MPEDRRDRPGEESDEVNVKVVDRRRFRPDGAPIDPSADAPAFADATPAPDERDARIDELTRAYAALVEDNKAFRARLERERARVLEAERADVAQALLEATDDLERALAAVSGAGDVPGEAVRTLAEGVRLTLAALHRRIQALGAERIGVVGARFDPRVAEAVDTVPVTDAAEDEQVLSEVRAGYRIGDRVLRPARVRVGRLA